MEKTTNTKNQIPNEQRNQNLAEQETAGEVNKANREKFAITNNATSNINKSIADNMQNLSIDSDKLTKTKEFMDDFMVSMDVTTDETKLTMLFKLLYLNG